jgi:Zn-dependent protease/predicted transcriptional regulator
MQAQIKLGRIFGIAIGLHYSWLILALLVVLSLADQFRAVNPMWGATVIWTIAIITALLFFASILLHELSHAAVAKARGLPVHSITLFALGGVSLIEKESSDAGTEFWMGIAGPITSFLIGLVCLILAWITGWTPAAMPPGPLTAMLMWLGYINIALAVFNLIPGYPLDGGRVLRAIVWWLTGNSTRATRVAALVGQFVAFSFIVVGLFRFFGGAGFGGLWMTLIGWFLLDAARASYAQVEMTETMNGVNVQDVMALDCPVVDANSNIQTFVDEHLLRSGRRCFVVEEQGRIVGLITPHEVKGIDRALWPITTVDKAMRPLNRLHAVAPDTPITEALAVMGREDVNQLPVVSGGHLAGIISRGNILRMLRTRADLQV